MVRGFVFQQVELHYIFNEAYTPWKQVQVVPL